jgi:uncharacterized protein (DUF1499 family)
LPITALLLALLAVLALMAAALGARLGYWQFRGAFGAMRWIAYGGLAAGALGLIATLRTLKMQDRKRMILGLAAIVIGVGAAWIPYSARIDLRAAPRLSDITTDTALPPPFVKAAELRAAAGARNPVTYGPKKAALQAKHYPDIKPVRLTIAPAAAFDKALAVVGEKGWTVTAADKAKGRIEAFETSFWFGFIDDVVIRIQADGTGSLIDIRSSSRIGRRDARVNANRVRSVIAMLKAG